MATEILRISRTLLAPGDEIYISLEKLWEQKLLKELPVSELAGSTRVQYEQVRTWKETYLREAFQAFIEKGLDQTEEYQTFAAQKWVQEYGLFRAFKKANGGLCWNDWKPEHKNWPEHKTEVAKAVREEADYQIFLQYLFYCQWMEMKNAANAMGSALWGDVPFYVGVDSVDVWAGKKKLSSRHRWKIDLYRGRAAGLFQRDRTEMGESNL